MIKLLVFFPYYSYFVLNEEGSPDTTWWNSNGTVASYVDFTNPEAAAWWRGRIQQLMETHDIDSIKCDAGESNWAPEVINTLKLINS